MNREKKKIKTSNGLEYLSNTDLKLVLIFLCLVFSQCQKSKNTLAILASYFEVIDSSSTVVGEKFWISFSRNHTLQILVLFQLL